MRVAPAERFTRSRCQADISVKQHAGRHEQDERIREAGDVRAAAGRELGEILAEDRQPKRFAGPPDADGRHAVCPSVSLRKAVSSSIASGWNMRTRAPSWRM